LKELKEIWNSILERFTNPLIFSFVVSWLVFNWKVPAALFYDDSSHIIKAGYQSVFGYIDVYLTQYNEVFWPVCVSLTYTFLMPFVSAGVKVLFTLARKKGDDWSLSVLKGGKIPVDRYIRFREEYDKSSKLLQDTIEKESSNAIENARLQNELLSEKSKVNSLASEVENWKESFRIHRDVKILNGFWTLTYRDTVKTNLKGDEDIFITDGKYFIIQKDGSRKHSFNIINFYYDRAANTMFFTKDVVEQKELYEVERVKYNNNSLTVESSEELVGTENVSTRVRYRRKTTNIEATEQLESEIVRSIGTGAAGPTMSLMNK
jgi:hypothetical protein